MSWAGGRASERGNEQVGEDEEDVCEDDRSRQHLRLGPPLAEKRGSFQSRDVLRKMTRRLVLRVTSSPRMVPPPRRLL